MSSQDCICANIINIMLTLRTILLLLFHVITGPRSAYFGAALEDIKTLLQRAKNLYSTVDLTQASPDTCHKLFRDKGLLGLLHDNALIQDHET